MHRSHTCGALRQSDVNKDVQLAGWVQRIRDKGFVLWIDLRDRYGVTQLVLDEERCDAALIDGSMDPAVRLLDLEHLRRVSTPSALLLLDERGVASYAVWWGLTLAAPNAASPHNMWTLEWDSKGWRQSYNQPKDSPIFPTPLPITTQMYSLRYLTKSVNCLGNHISPPCLWTANR